MTYSTSDASGETAGGRIGSLAGGIRPGELDLRCPDPERDPARVRRRRAGAPAHALRLLSAAAAPECRRPRGPAAQAAVRPGPAQTTARLSRALRRRRPGPALFPDRFHV